MCRVRVLWRTDRIVGASRGTQGTRCGFESRPTHRPARLGSGKKHLQRGVLLAGAVIAKEAAVKFLIMEMPHGGGLGAGATTHPDPHADRWLCVGEQRVEVCYGFRDQPGGLYIIDAGSEEELVALLDRGPVAGGVVREVHVLWEG